MEAGAGERVAWGWGGVCAPGWDVELRETAAALFLLHTRRGCQPAPARLLLPCAPPPLLLQGLTIQAEPLSLAAWLATDSSAALLQSLAGPRGIPQPSGSLLQADLQSQQQCGRAFGAVQVCWGPGGQGRADRGRGAGATVGPSRGCFWVFRCGARGRGGSQAVYCVCPADPRLPTPSPTHTPHSTLLAPPRLAPQEFEAGRQQLAAALPTSRGAVWQSMIDFIVQLAGSLHVSEETTHDTLQLCDRLLGAPGVEAGEATPLAAALLLLKCRQGE